MAGVFKPYRDAQYQKLLDQDKDIKRWYNNLAKSSLIVADIYLRRLGSFCRYYEITTAKYAKLPLRKMENMEASRPKSVRRIQEMSLERPNHVQGF